MLSTRRVAAVGALIVAVSLAHLWLAGQALPSGLGGDSRRAATLAIDVSFVRELLPAEPAGLSPTQALAAPPRAAPQERVPDAVAEAASAPVPMQSMLRTPAPEPLREAPPEPAAAAAASSGGDVPAAASPVPPTPLAGALGGTGGTGGSGTAAHFEWPPSTRLEYHLSGDVRGPVEGRASVEWRRQGNRYQVDLRLSIGPAFAPLMSRTITSEGEITAAGLHPTRYDETTRALLREPRRLVVQMGGEQVVLAGGRTLPRPPGLQDSASQFVQLTWLFTTDPSRLREGQQIELPLALPRRVSQWVYEVGATEAIDTPAGPVPAVHVKPRRETGAPRPGGELLAEVWFAPSLQYLPVRMLIRQDAETFVELRLAGLPQQAAEGGGRPAAPAASAPTGR